MLDELLGVNSTTVVVMNDSKPCDDGRVREQGRGLEVDI
jgi:hypothetical protein